MAHDKKYGEVKVEKDSERNPVNGTDELVVVFRVQDALLVPLLARYKNLRTQAVKEGEQPPTEWFADLDALSSDVLAWQQENPDRVKLPD